MAYSTALESIWQLLSGFIFTRVRLEKEKVYCCHIWTAAAQPLISNLDNVQNHLRGLIGDNSPPPTDPILFHSFHAQAPFFSLSVSDIYSHTTSTELNHPESSLPTFRTFISYKTHSVTLYL